MHAYLRVLAFVPRKRRSGLGTREEIRLHAPTGGGPEAQSRESRPGGRARTTKRLSDGGGARDLGAHATVLSVGPGPDLGTLQGRARASRRGVPARPCLGRMPRPARATSCQAPVSAGSRSNGVFKLANSAMRSRGGGGGHSTCL